MEGIRIVKLPPATMVTSGEKSLEEFDQWWSEVDKERKDKFFPRDFMWFNPEANRLEWFYAVSSEMTDTGGFDTVEFPGGLYAAAISRDEDDADGERVYSEIKKWIQNSGAFTLNEGPGHYTMFHVITPDEVYAALGYRQLDIFIPIKIAR